MGFIFLNNALYSNTEIQKCGLFVFVCVHVFNLGRGIASTLGGPLLYSSSMLK